MYTVTRFIIFVLVLAFSMSGLFKYFMRFRHVNDNTSLSDDRIWGLKESTFYLISLVSLFLLYLSNFHPYQQAWKNQNKIDKYQNEIIDSLKKENNILKSSMKEMKDLLVLHNKLDERIIESTHKRDVVVVNNHMRRKKCNIGNCGVPKGHTVTGTLCDKSDL